MAETDIPAQWARSPEQASQNPGAASWLPVLIAGTVGPNWYVRCPDCGRPNDHSPGPGFRVSGCGCAGMLVNRRINGYVIAPPGTTLAPYPRFCPPCYRSAADDTTRENVLELLYTPMDLDWATGGPGLIATYVCDESHRWTHHFVEPEGEAAAKPPLERTAQPAPFNAPRCALYRHYDEADVLLYVGISERPVERGRAHAKNSEWVQYATRIEAEWMDTRAEAEQAEWIAIREEAPVFNRSGAEGAVDSRVEEYLAKRRQPASPQLPLHPRVG